MLYFYSLTRWRSSPIISSIPSSCFQKRSCLLPPPTHFPPSLSLSHQSLDAREVFSSARICGSRDTHSRNLPPSWQHAPVYSRARMFVAPFSWCSPENFIPLPFSFPASWFALELSYSWILINAADFLLSISLPLRDKFQDECRRLEVHYDGSREWNDASCLVFSVFPRGSKHVVRALRVALFTVTCVAARRGALSRVASRHARGPSRTGLLFSFSLSLLRFLTRFFPVVAKRKPNYFEARARHGLTNARHRPWDSKAAAKSFRGRARPPHRFIIVAVRNVRTDCSRTWRARAVL